MDFSKYRDYPIVGDTIFGEQRGDTYAWAIFGFTVLFTGWMLVERGAKVALLAGGGLILLSVPHVLPGEYYRASVVLRIFGILYYVVLWAGIFLFFPDAPTFFEGNW
jgi:hypothetical protein